MTEPANYLTANAGGGLKWFATRHWGVRADYRLMLVTDNSTSSAFFARDGARYGHRIYGGLLFTY